MPEVPKVCAFCGAEDDGPYRWSEVTQEWFCDEQYDGEDATEKVRRLRDELLQNPEAKAAYDVQKARIDARVAERQSDGTDHAD